MNAIRTERRRARSRATVLLASGLLACVAFTSVPAQTATASEGVAAPASTAATVSVSRNVYAAGGQVRPGAVAGDLVAVGGRVIVDQPVKGDAMLAGGSVDVRAAVGDDVRAAGGDVTIESSVGGELFASGGSVTLTSSASVAQGASLFGGRVAIDGRIDGALRVAAQKIVLNGPVSGNVRLVGEQIELGPNARIGGALSYASANELQKADGATITGTVTREERRAKGRDDHERDRHLSGGGAGWVGSILTFLALLACAAVFLVVFPVFAARASDTVKASPWMALAIGFGALVAVPVLAVLLFITLLGIPLGIVVVALYPVLLLTGYVVGVLFIGRAAQTAMGKDAAGSFPWTVGFFALALLLVMLLSRLPFVGGLALGVITVVGIGACVLELYHRRQAGAARPAT